MQRVWLRLWLFGRRIASSVAHGAFDIGLLQRGVYPSWWESHLSARQAGIQGRSFISGGLHLFQLGLYLQCNWGTFYAQGVLSTVTRLLSEPRDPVLRSYLVIATAYLRRNVFVHNGCLLEEMLSRLPWCRVMQRHEEMSNAIIFYINDWSAFPVSWDPAVGRSKKPDMGTVTVSRRGVINVRLGWHDGVEWSGNDGWIGLVDAIRDCLLELC